MQVKVVGYNKPILSKKKEFTPIKNADETNVSGMDNTNVTAVREHLGMPTNNQQSEMAATFRSDLPPRKIDENQLRAVSKKSSRVASPNFSAYEGSQRSKLNPSNGGTLSPGINSAKLNQLNARNTARENGFGVNTAEKLAVPGVDVEKAESVRS